MLAAATALTVAGCGEKEKDFANEPRPPTPINVAGYIAPDRVSVSPASFGAGPIVLIVANQSATSQQVVFRGPGVSQTAGPINPGDTAELKVLVRQGTYSLSTGGRGIQPATVRVGPERESAQNKVLQP